METKNQQNVSLVLLVSLFLQSCGVDVPRDPENKQVSGEELTNPVTQNGATAHGSIETCREQDMCTQSALSGATHVFDASKEPEIASVHRLSDQEIMQYVQKSPTKSTQELVKDFNQPVSNPKERLALHAWVQSYIHWFYDQAVESLGTEQCKEYAYLAHLQPRSEADHALLYQYFRSLARSIESSKPVDEYFVQALDNTLQHIAPETFKAHIGELDQVGDILLKQIKPRHTTQSVRNCSQHTTLLKALHSILLVMYKLDNASWAKAEGLYTDFQEKMAAIQGASKYYPYSYHAQLLSQGLEILAGCAVHDTAQQVWEGCKAWSHTLQMVSQLMEADRETVEQVKQRYIQLKNDIMHLHTSSAECAWFERLIDITAISMQVLEDKQKWPAFVERIQALKEDNSIWESEYTEDCRALRYGAVKQLTLLALHSDRAVESLEMLKSFTELAIRYRDQHMIEAIFEGVLAVAKSEQTGLQREGAADTARSYLLSLQEEGDKAASQLLEPTSKRPRLDMGASSETRPDTAVNLPPKALVSAMKKWLQGTTLEEKLNLAKPCETAPRQDSIFKAVRTAWVAGTRVGESLQQPRESILSEEAEIQAKLKACYQQPHFKQVPLWVGEAFVSLGDVKCNLKLNEKIKVQEQEQVDSLNTRHKQVQWIQTPIKLEELFRSRKLEPEGPEEEVNKVLIVGEAGIGKTTLTRKLAHAWSIGKWGQEFAAVYLLPVRRLCYTTLTTAIANECFTGIRGEAQTKRLHEYIEASLTQPTTLVMLDGLDEQEGVNANILWEAKRGVHKLLLTSRPHGIETEYDLVDIEIDLVGLDERQQDYFVKSMLADTKYNTADKLVEFM